MAFTGRSLFLSSTCAILVATACGGDDSGDDDSGASETGGETTDDTGSDSTEGADTSDADSGDTGDSGDSGDTGGTGEVPGTYDFSGPYAGGESSVSYSGQIFRQVLVKSLIADMTAIQAEIDGGAIFEAGEVSARLAFYYQFDSATGGTLEHGVSTEPATLQTTFDDISSDKDLQGKIAGNDETGQHKDWSTDLVGWDGSSPDELILAWFDAVDALAVEYSLGNIPEDPDGAQIPVYYVAPDGRDYKQLIEKFLLGAVNFSQGADDYLDDDTEGKGLLSDHTMADEGKAYSALEHQWDEGFGYWGGARDYLDHGDDLIADTGYFDTDEDGSIDLLSEYNFSASVNAAKRDRGSADEAKTDYTEQTMTAFLTGRHILATTEGPLDDATLDELREQRDLALDGWEKSLAATAVHYFNDTLQDMNNTTDYSFADHAKHWSELKGFLMALQFNPHSLLGDSDHEAIDALVGTAPVLEGDTAVYAADLVTARDMLGAAYGFDAANMGDENGEGGW